VIISTGITFSHGPEYGTLVSGTGTCWVPELSLHQECWSLKYGLWTNRNSNHTIVLYTAYRYR